MMPDQTAEQKPAKPAPRGAADGTARPRRRLRRVGYWTAITGIWLTILGGVGFAWIAHDLPDLSDLPPPGQAATAELLAVNGKTLVRYGPVYGDWLDYPEIPEVMILALLASEDRRFFGHGGLDPLGVLRAAWANLRAGDVVQGGSTLTQQLAKNLFLTSERNFKRKAQELLLALWLERALTKPEILALYLNRVYFGAGTYGIDAAARTYFGHAAGRLTLSEAAMLAGLVKAPSRLAPTHNLAGARERAEVVLGAMVDAGYLTRRAAERAAERPASLAADAAGENVRYFTDWIMARAERLVGPNHGPLTILTTLDPMAQAAAETAVTERLADEGAERRASQAALVALSRDGAVKAMMGGRSYGASQYNRAVQARRQPGSAFKPVVYLAGLEAGLRPSTVMQDAPITLEGWSPENFSGRYAGEVTLTDAFARSLNTVSVRVARHAGLPAVVSLARRLGIESPLAPLPSIALGAEEVTLLELSSVYASIAAGGRRVEPYGIVEIRGSDGEVLHRTRPEDRPFAIRPDHAAQLTEMMTVTMREGTGRRARLDRPAAGKTGTSQDFRDAVFMGFTSDLVAGVWVGNDDDTPMREVAGSGLPARIWSDFMIDAHIGRPVRPVLAQEHADAS